jgi:hypothetical protein
MPRECTSYVTDDYDDDLAPCRCPVCMGFLPREIFQDPLICKKCGSELAAIPEVDEDTKEPGENGKICVITKRKKTNEQTKEERRTNRLVKQGAKAWKGWL